MKQKSSAVKFVYKVLYTLFDGTGNTYETIVKAYSRPQAQFLFYKWHAPSYHRIQTIIEAEASVRHERQGLL